MAAIIYWEWNWKTRSDIYDYDIQCSTSREGQTNHTLVIGVLQLLQQCLFIHIVLKVLNTILQGSTTSAEGLRTHGPPIF